MPYSKHAARPSRSRRSFFLKPTVTRPSQRSHEGRSTAVQFLRLRPVSFAPPPSACEPDPRAVRPQAGLKYWRASERRSWDAMSLPFVWARVGGSVVMRTDYEGLSDSSSAFGPAMCPAGGSSLMTTSAFPAKSPLSTPGDPTTTILSMRRRSSAFNSDQIRRVL